MFILVVGFLFRSAMGPVEYPLNMLGEQAAVRPSYVPRRF